MMAMLMQLLRRKKEPTEEDRQLMQTYGEKVEFLDLPSAQPLIAAVKR